MGKVVSGLTISLDGYVAGPDQRLDQPLGAGGERLHRWMFEQPEENAAEIGALVSAGAYVMGRHMFDAGRGTWDPDWRGWWGDDPPYHAPVYVLTHYPREPLEMEGGTTFHFVTDGIEPALEQARAAAGDRDVSVAGGASTINQCLAAGLIEELRLQVAPMLLGGGERLFAGVGGRDVELVGSRATELAVHLNYRLRPADEDGA